MAGEKLVYRWWVLATSVPVFTCTFGMGLVGINPVLGFIFRGSGYVLSGLLFPALKETGLRAA